jgi:hypothetical protein
MERCEECGHEFSVTSRRQAKRIEAHKNVTGKIACDNCIKKIRRKALQEAVAEVMQSVIEKRMAPESEPETVDEIIENDPVFKSMVEEENTDGICR